MSNILVPVLSCLVYASIYASVSNLNAPRRETQFFAVPFNCLCNSDKSISYIGLKLYNRMANIINKDIKYFTTCIQNKLLNSFTSTVNKHLLTAQALEPNDKDWNDSNFVLLET